MVRYLDCQKNHAAHSGGHVLDGCCEFMPAGDETLKCAACDCHRSFHRREADLGSSTGPPPHAPPSTTTTATPNCYNISFTNNTNSTKPRVPMSPHRRNHESRSPVMMAFGGAAAESSSEEVAAAGYGCSRKRFRTKFTPEQKEKMTEFADRIGWRIQKQEESELRRFCLDVGVDRQVFKVWLHNNKQVIKRRHP